VEKFNRNFTVIKTGLLKAPTLSFGFECKSNERLRGSCQ